MIGFFDEDKGVKSITRLSFFMIVIVALIISCYQVYLTGKVDLPGFLAMIGTATTLKIWQKTIEVKSENSEKKE